MFICQNCHNQIPAKTSSYLLPTKLRNKCYPKRLGVIREINHAKKGYQDDPGGTGTEIAAAIRVCMDCYNKLAP